MPSQDTLTLLMYTHNRPAFLARALRYYSDFPYPLLIMDSSTESNESLVRRYGNERIRYHHCAFGYNELISKIQSGLERVTTPFVTFVCDDDFTLKEGLRECLDFMKDRPDYSLCMGYSLLYVAAAERNHYFAREIKTLEDFCDDTPAVRIQQLLSHYYPPFYALARTDMQRRWFKHIGNDTVFDYLEFGQAFQLLNLGKLRILPVPYAIRELNYPAPEHQSDLFRTFSHPTHEGNNKEKFFSLLSSLLCETMPALKAAQARAAVETAARGLVECLRTGKTLMVAEVFSSEWKNLSPRPEWTFGAKQFMEMPFYNSGFFTTLEGIDFLIRAMPCGKHQMAELKPLLEAQDKLVEKARRAKTARNLPEALETLSAVIRQNAFHGDAVRLLSSILSDIGKAENAKILGDWARKLDPTAG